MPQPSLCPPNPCNQTLLHHVVMKAVEDTLCCKGYVKSSQGGPTFYVSQQSWLVRKCDGNVAQDPYFQTRQTQVYTSYDLEPRYRHNEKIREQAKVIVEFRKNPCAPAFWRGMATVNLDPCASACVRGEQIRKAVMKALKKFPRRGDR